MVHVEYFLLIKGYFWSRAELDKETITSSRNHRWSSVSVYLTDNSFSNKLQIIDCRSVKSVSYDDHSAFQILFRLGNFEVCFLTRPTEIRGLTT